MVSAINVSKSSGLKNVSSSIVKEAFRILIPEVTHMFNLSLETAAFPIEWKKALVIPIPKTGNLTDLPTPPSWQDLRKVGAQSNNYLSGRESIAD